MDVFVFVITILALVVVAPITIIMHYTTKWREMKTLSADDERLLDDLWKTAQSLERRVESLETILDEESPDWRERRDA
ncbi:MAG: envelope stress response membrane protein PspB [Pseudomonadota bacterium]